MDWRGAGIKRIIMAQKVCKEEDEQRKQSMTLARDPRANT